MSCNNSANSSSSRNKHYTPIERKVFLQILDHFKHVIELKKSDGSTIKEKEVAWKEICSRYNESSLISQEVKTIIISNFLVNNYTLRNFIIVLLYNYYNFVNRGLFNN